MKNQNVTEEQKESLKLNATLVAIQQGKISKTISDSQYHPLLNGAKAELHKVQADLQAYAFEVFLRNLFFILAIQRQHNIWKEENVKVESEVGGQMRQAGRSIVRWLWANMQEWLLTRKEGYLYNLNLIVEYANYDAILHNQIRTTKGSKKSPAIVTSKETMNIPLNIVAELIAQNIRKGVHMSLIARWLPKVQSGKNRYTKLVVGKTFKGKQFDPKGKVWCKLNGEKIYAITPVKEGDIISYPRAITSAAKERIKKDQELVHAVCEIMDWDKTQYTKFRHQYMQETPEHKFASGSITNFAKDQFVKWVGSLSSGQQHVVSTHLCYMDSSKKLVANPNGKWYNTELPKWYLEAFVAAEEKKAQVVREAMAKGDNEKAKAVATTMKTKTAGTQTIDLFTDLIQQRKSPQEIDTIYTALTSKMDMSVPVYCCIDGSGSMTGARLEINGTMVSPLDAAIVIALTFMLTNPVLELGQSCMWYGSEGTFTGVTRYRNTAPNPYTTNKQVITDADKIVDRTKGFAANFASLKAANPGHVSSTNPGKVVESFLDLVKRGQMHIENLPKVLVFVTDDEGNSGMSPAQFIALANKASWFPLFVFWGLTGTHALEQYKNSPNVLVERGFSENTLSSVLQFIRKGTVNMFDSLFAIAENPAFSLIKYEA